MFSALMMLFVFVSLGLPAALVAIPWAAMTGNFGLMNRWGMGVIRLGVRAAGVRVSVAGVENIPAGTACIFLSNHVSNLDPPVLLPVLPGRASVFLKKELMKIPVLGVAMRMARYVPVSRGHSREEAQKSVDYAADVLRSGIHIMLFPEGTRSLDGNLLPFKKGAFFLAAETRAPMVPVVIHGTAQMMRKGSLKVHPGQAVVQFLPAVWPRDYSSREDLMEAVRGEMEMVLAASAAT
jgi:1-acyl-sn-glycerol-3-phosphate acyltransferase